MDINVDLLQWSVNFLIKKLQLELSKMEIFLIQNKLNNYANQLLKKLKVHSPFIDNIRGADLAGKQFISKFNKGFRFLFCAIDIYNKNTSVIGLKDEKGITIVDAFQKVLDE